MLCADVKLTFGPAGAFRDCVERLADRPQWQNGMIGEGGRAEWNVVRLSRTDTREAPLELLRGSDPTGTYRHCAAVLRHSLSVSDS